MVWQRKLTSAIAITVFIISDAMDGDDKYDSDRIDGAAADINDNESTASDKIASSSYPSWNNETLYPPEQKRNVTPSPVWKFGGFKKVDGKLSHKITCGLCGKVYAYANSPGNYGNHLKNDHHEEWQNIEASKSQQLKLTDLSFKSID